MNKLREILKYEMGLRNWNDYDMEDKSGVPQSTTHRFLSGKQNDPRSKTVRRWAKALNMTEAQLRGMDSHQMLNYIDGEVIRKSLPSPDRLSEAELINLVRSTHHIPFSNWSSIAIFLSSTEIKEYREMIIDKSELKHPMSNGAFMVQIDTDDFNKHFKKGTKLIFNPNNDDQMPLLGQILLVTFNGDHKTLVKYRPIAGKIFFELLETGFPNSIEIPNEYSYTLHGIAILECWSNPLD